MTITHDFLFPNLFLSQGRGSRIAFKYIREDSKKNPGASILINSDQGTSKTVFSGAIIMYFMMEKDAYINKLVSSYTFDSFAFISFSNNAKVQVENDFNRYLYKIGGVSIFNRKDFSFYSVNTSNLDRILDKIHGRVLMIIDEPQKTFSENDTKRSSKDKSKLYDIVNKLEGYYKIFLTATPMDNSIFDMVTYISSMINKKPNKITKSDILDPDTYKGRIYFIASSVVNFINRNLVYTRERLAESVVSNDGLFTLYQRKDEPNKYLNTVKLEISTTQMRSIEYNINKRNYGVGGISMEYLKLSVVPGKMYSHINSKPFSKTFDPDELFEISPKFHFIYKYTKSFKEPVKAIVKVNIYSQMLVNGSSNDNDVYLFDYLKMYPKTFREFTNNTRELDPKIFYYINGFSKSYPVVRKTLDAFNSLSEYPAANIVCFISEKYATGYTFSMILLFFLWDYGFNYSKDSQAFGRISRNNQMPQRGPQEALILEQDKEYSGDYVKATYYKILKGDLTDDEYNKYLQNIHNYYSVIDSNDGDDEDDLDDSELEFRKKFRALYPSYTRKRITHNKLRSISQVENIIISQNMLKDLTGASGPSQLFPLREPVEEGKYAGKIIEIDENDTDPYKLDEEYYSIFSKHVEIQMISNSNIFGLNGDKETDSIIINNMI